MNSIALRAFLLALFAIGAHAAETPPRPETTETAEVEVEVLPNNEGAEPSKSSSEVADFCFFPGTPPSDNKYTVIRKLKVGKNSYGGIKEILPKLAIHARKNGADAIINYNGSQRFGFFPWRMVRPVVQGVAIKWNDPKKPDCTRIGGTTLETILATDQAPHAKTKDQIDRSKDVYAELIRLDDLRKRGILTESEFEAQKKNLLEGK